MSWLLGCVQISKKYLLIDLPKSQIYASICVSLFPPLSTHKGFMPEDFDCSNALQRLLCFSIAAKKKGR